MRSVLELVECIKLDGGCNEKIMGNIQVILYWFDGICFFWIFVHVGRVVG